MGQKKRQYRGDFKGKVVFAAIREEGALQNLASHFGVNPNMISKWKQQALCQMSEGFSRKQERQSLDQEEVLKSLHVKMGELTVEKDFLEQVFRKLGLGGYKKW